MKNAIQLSNTLLLFCIVALLMVIVHNQEKPVRVAEPVEVTGESIGPRWAGQHVPIKVEIEHDEPISVQIEQVLPVPVDIQNEPIPVEILQ